MTKKQTRKPTKADKPMTKAEKELHVALKPKHKLVKPTAAEIKRDHEVLSGTTPKRKTAIMARTAECVVEYDFKKDGKMERRSKHFANAHDAKKFFVKKDEMDRNPVMKAVEPKQPQAVKPVAPPKRITPGTWTTVCVGDAKHIFQTNLEADTFFVEESKKPKHPEVLIRQATLAEAFPADPVAPGTRPTDTRCTGDPTSTNADLKGEGVHFMHPPELSEEEIKAEARKQAKKLRRQQRKGDSLWHTADTKTVVKAVWQKPQGAFYDRWLIKYSDGTELATSQLSVIWSREHKDHHVRVGSQGHIDGLSNKNYEEILRRSAVYALQQAMRNAQGLANFRATDDVQKEMDKRISKKVLKAEKPFEPTEIELAKKLADLANYYCTTPAAFFKTEEERAKNPHTAMITNGALDSLFAKHGIDRLACTIRIVQYAKRMHNNLTPRLEVGGEQIGTPELAKASDKAKKTETITVIEKDASGKDVKVVKVVAKSSSGPKRIGATTYVIELLKTASSSKPVSKAQVIKYVSERMDDKDNDWLQKRVNSVLSKTYMQERSLALAITDKGYWFEGKVSSEAAPASKAAPEVARRQRSSKGGAARAANLRAAEAKAQTGKAPKKDAKRAASKATQAAKGKPAKAKRR